MIKKIAIALLLLTIGISWAGTTIWTLNSSVTTDVFNGVSSPDGFFTVAVGENGTIVHFNNGDDGTLMPSGTTRELYDVYVSSSNLAVAAGEDVVLLWDGSQWNPLFTDNSNTIYTGTWISPEEDVVLYESLGQFNVICPYLPDEPTQPFCRAYSQPMLTACGNSNDIKLLMASGDIQHVDNFLGDLTNNSPIHEEPVPLFLSAIWAPPYACLTGPIEPLELYAIRNGNEFWRFDGEEWSDMNVNVPFDQTLTWLSGTSSNNIVATGFRPNGQGGNDGVIWIYDGQSWTEDTNLPTGTPGLTDIVATSGPPDLILASDFDAVKSNRLVEPPRYDILAVAEEGERLFTADLFPSISSDLSMEKRLLTSEPIRQGDRITFQLVIFNRGPQPVSNFDIYDLFTPQIAPVSNTCGYAFHKQISNYTYYKATIPSLGVNETLVCEFQFDVVGTPGETITNQASAVIKDDFIYGNNTGLVRGVEIQPPQ